MPADDHFQIAIERMTAALRAQLEREFAEFAEPLARALTEARDRVSEIAGERDASQREVDALKRAVADAREHVAQQAAETAAADMRRHAEMQAQIARVEEDTRRQIAEIQVAAAEERERAAQQAAEAAADEARRHADAQVAQLREAAQKQAEEIRRSAEGQVRELRITLEGQLDDLRRAAHAQADETRRAAQNEIEEARRIAAAQVEDVQRVADEQIAEIRSRLEAQFEDVRRRARADVEQARGDLERARAEADAGIRAAHAEAEEIVIAQLSAAQADAEQKIQDAIDRTRTETQQAELTHTARLVDAIRRLDDARSLGDTLDALADCAARHVERAAVLVVNGDKLRVRRLAGFAAPPPAPHLDLQSAGMAGAVVSTGVTVSRAAVDPADAQGSRQPALPAFAQDAGPRHAAALPIVVGGRVVAVLYGDSPAADATAVASRWPPMLEVLARHTSRALEALTVERATGLAVPRQASRPLRIPAPGAVEHAGAGDEDAARRYARLLVSEIRMYHEPVVDAGRKSRDLRTRLGGEIDRARRLYEERVPQTVRNRSDYFEQELVRTLADGDRSLLG